MRDDEEELSTATVEPSVENVRRPTDRLRRSLTDKELSAAAVGVLLEEDRSRLRDEVADLSQFRARYHDAEKARAIVQAHLEAIGPIETMRGVCLTLGGVLAGLTPSMLTATSTPTGVAFVVGGAVLLVGIGLILAAIFLKPRVNEQ
ncbi:MAG TPA: hypothetical protein VGM19_01635 [Armatimonadota bacterium]|jgi:hypothetical protein